MASHHYPPGTRIIHPEQIKDFRAEPIVAMAQVQVNQREIVGFVFPDERDRLTEAVGSVHLMADERGAGELEPRRLVLYVYNPGHLSAEIIATRAIEGKDRSAHPVCRDLTESGAYVVRLQQARP